MGTDHIHTHPGHCPGLFLIEDKGNGKEVGGHRFFHKLNFQVIAQPLFLQPFPELAVNQTNGRKIIDTAEAQVPDFLDQFLMAIIGISGINTADHRPIFKFGQYFPARKVKHQLIAIGKWHHTSNRRNPRRPKPTGTKSQQ